jgi:BirA family biotin operon repressor/biotin-[acetyl-CoA-carboxylase] ligase
MNYIKFDTIPSTNDFLKKYGKEHNLPDFFYVYTDWQTSGRGQREHTWQSDCCKNILISIYLHPKYELKQQYILNQVVSLAIVRLLQKNGINKVQIKKPNDILAGKQKIAGILIENRIQNKHWEAAVIGIGLNVNQTDFVNLPNAVSMKNITGKEYSIKQLIINLINEIKKQYQRPADKLEQDFKSLLTQI